MAVRKRLMTGSISRPRTLSCGPVKPASVKYAVPPGKICSSAVCTWVWVPTTAETWPSNMRARAIFSEVASACMSTKMMGVIWRNRATSARAHRNGFSSGARPEQARFGLQQQVDFLVVPQMVAGGDDAHAGVQDFQRSIDSDAGAAGGVFAVGDDHVQLMGLAQTRQQPAQGVPPRFANNVADKKKIHRPQFSSRGDCGKRAFGRAAAGEGAR